MEKEEPIKQFFIPNNYSGGVNIAGHNLSTRNVAESIVLCALLLVPTWIISRKFLQLTTSISASVIAGGTGALIGLFGFKNEPFSAWVKYFIKYKKSMRICYYNTRPKFEAKPLDLQSDNLDSSIMLRKQAQEIKNKLMSSYTTFNQGTRPDNLFFEDDIGIVDTPDNYEGYEKEVKKKRKEKRVNGKKKKQKKKKAK